MLYAETPEMPMHTLGVLVLEPDEPSSLSETVSAFDVTRRLLKERIHLVPEFRRRLVQDPFQIGDPYWIEDPAFHIDKHLMHISLPSPGGMRELCDFVGLFASQSLPRDRPLWKAALVEGLQDGAIALVMKIHHAIMDGGQSVAVAQKLLDKEPGGWSAPPAEDLWIPDREPTLPWLAADALRTLGGKPRRAVEAATKVAFALRSKGKRRAPDAAHSKSTLFEAPPTRFNRALTPNRSVALADVSFEEVKGIKDAFGVTVNDVVLAGCCGSLRSWLSEHGGLPDRPLVATVPVSVRNEGDEAGNRVSVMRVHLPVQEDDPVARLMAIHNETRLGKKRHGHGSGSDALKHFTDVVTNVTVPWVLTQAMQFYAGRHLADRLPPPWNLVISNVVGPQVPLYAPGARLTKLYPLGPVVQGAGLDLTVMSAVGRLCFGAMACTELVPDLQDIGAGFVDEVKTLLDSVAR
jgi:WS/DGAT/MGAT family acyltransferase